jgi:UDP-glucose 4-epimerase
VAPTIYGDGEQTRDYLYVDDVVDAFVRASDRADGKLLNVGTGIETSVLDLYDLIAAAAGYEGRARLQPARSGELRRSALDPSAAATQLGWRPWTTLEDGVTRTVEWFRSQGQRD